MIRTDNLVQWQLYDEATDAVLPWLTHPFLDWLRQQDFSHKRILEFGAGRSTRWWRKRAQWVTSVDTSEEWLKQVWAETEGMGLCNGMLVHKDINEGDQARADEYVNAGDPWGPCDVVVVDGILRNSCLEKALSMPRPLLLIADNWFQSYVWLSQAAVDLMAPYENCACVFEQPDHTDNDGINKWKTAMWYLTNEQP